MSNFKINTKCLVGGYKPGNGEPRQIPIIQSTTFKYDTSEAMGKMFDLEATGYFYSRLQNPTCDFVAPKFRSWRVVLRQCSLPPVRQRASLPCLTSARQAATSLLPLLFTAAAII